MKSISILAISITPALGGELIQHLHHPGYCNSPLLGTFPHLSNPICSHDTLLTKYQPPSRSSPAHRAWDRVSSCYQNGTQEYCVFANTQFADGRGISVITSPERAEYMANLPAFSIPNITKGFNQDLVADRPKNYNLVHVPGKDVGVVAAKPLNRGDHIMSNTASVIIDYGAFDNVPHQDILRLQADAVDFLPALHRSRFMNLSTHSEVEGHLKRVDKILSTNAFDVELEDEVENGLYLVFPEIARFNHDCRPNADYYFDPDTLSQHIHAIRPIAAGEEISITYIDPLKSRAKRTKRLHSVWGFHCSCSQCTQSAAITAASDARIAQIHELREHLSDYSGESAATPQMADLFISLYEQERMQSTIYEAYTFAAIEWNGVGEPWTAIKYARLAVEYGLPSVGPRDRDVIEMRALAEDPWGHWSWMLRTSKRMGWEAMRPIGGTYMRGGADDDDE